ncbi:hypothetical protein [uncultured Campylobacter sp.]|uniref:hypothetical protein n=1 Tax=uncultured Campylobacter sp. TaxID=218934 RepID=UPI002623A105|nr:hypothetical protein [uncultured Campylobacter sp.]
MGYDISYHAIGKDEISQWYFKPLKLAQKGDFEAIAKIAREAGMDEFYAEKYADGFRSALQYGTQGIFNKTHGFHIAVAQGYFREYFYTRGTAFSFLAEQSSKFKPYISDWREVLPAEFLAEFSGEIHNEIVENYCCGAYLSTASVQKLLRDYEAGGEVKSAVDEFYAQNLPVFLKALNSAAELGVGLLEATEVVEPNPIDLNRSESFSNLFNCDTQGALIYAEIAAQQIGEAIERDKVGGGGTTGSGNSASRGVDVTGGGSATEADGGAMKASGGNSVPCSGDTIEGGSENSAAEDHKDATCVGGEKSLFDKIKGLFK